MTNATIPTTNVRSTQPITEDLAPPTIPSAHAAPVQHTRRYSAIRRLVGRNAGLTLLYVLSLNLLPLLLLMPTVIAAAESGTLQTTVNDANLIGIAQAIGMLLGLGILLIIRRGQIVSRDFWVGAIDRRRMTPTRFLALTALLIMVGAMSDAITTGLTSLLRLLGISLTSNTLAMINQTMSNSVIMVVSVTVFAPIIEEILFRGMMMGSLRQRGKLFAIITTAVLFGAMHGDLIQGISAMFGGLLLGYIAMEYSLIWAIVFHFINNAILATGLTKLLALLPDAAKQPSYIAFLAVGSVIGLIILWSRRIEIRDYIATNRSPRGSYVGWTSLRFLLMVLFLIMATASSFSLM